MKPKQGPTPAGKESRKQLGSRAMRFCSSERFSKRMVMISSGSDWQRRRSKP